jgi:hypothetical protein
MQHPHAPDRHKVNQGSASPELDETYRILSALDRASKDITVKVKHSVQIDRAQYQVINFANANHRSILIDNVAACEIRIIDRPSRTSLAIWPRGTLTEASHPMGTAPMQEDIQ